MKNIHKIKENIYITSDEEIKEGDWVFSLKTNNIFKADSIEYLESHNMIEDFDKSFYINSKYSKKIILTTDSQLIKNGVQAIDDEFLEWFVNNPSCEEVEVNKLCYGALSGYTDAGYKITIPKEQQKQHLIDMMKADEELGLYDETEHLLSTEANKKRLLYDEGAKWQAERMYSEEDMLKSFMAGIKCESNKGENFEQFIKQFKKK